MLNFDGGAATVDFNIGKFMPSEGVPIMELFKYFYVGGGIGARYIDTKNDNTDKEKWCAAYGADAQFKLRLNPKSGAECRPYTWLRPLLATS